MTHDQRWYPIFVFCQRCFPSKISSMHTIRMNLLSKAQKVLPMHLFCCQIVTKIKLIVILGPLATKKFCDIAVEHQKKAKEANKRILLGFVRDLLPNQNWFHSKGNITKLCLNFHVKRNTFEDVCAALQSASSILQPYAIQAEALGRQRVCQLLDILAVEVLFCHLSFKILFDA